MGCDIMRILLTGLIAALLALPMSATVKACEGYDASAQAGTIDLSAVEKKDEMTKPKKPVVKKKKEKVEYMRAAPMPPGAK
jgi:hypothetical protein